MYNLSREIPSRNIGNTTYVPSSQKLKARVSVGQKRLRFRFRFQHDGGSNFVSAYLYTTLKIKITEIPPVSPAVCIYLIAATRTFIVIDSDVPAAYIQEL